MKKNVLFVITILVTGLDIHAQNTFPASGKVGIGTTSPLTLLHVKGVSSFGANISTANATRVLNLADANAVMRILRVHPTNAPAIELLSRTSTDGPNVAYWDMYAEPSDKSFRIRDRVTGANLDRFIINSAGNIGIGTLTPGDKLSIKEGAISFHHTSNDVPYVGIDYDVESDAMRFRANLYSTLLNTTYFTMQRSTGNIGIGTTEPFYPLEVTSGTATNVIHATSSYSGNSDKVALFASSVNTPGYGVGVEATGGYKGVRASAQAVGSIGGAFGLDGEASGGAYAYGVYGSAYDASSINAAGYFNGNVYANGVLLTSDRKFKKDISPVENALSQIIKLRPSTYQFKIEEYKGMRLPEGKQMGLIADELKQVFPELVQKAVKPARYDKKDRTKVIDPEVEYEAVNYLGLIPVLIASVQELNKKNDALVSENSELKERLMRIETMLTSGNGRLSPSSAYLENATPNPSRSTSVIRYQVPEGTTAARFTLVNVTGQVLKEVNLAGRVSGQVNLSTSDLTAGVYTYSLWIDGQQAATRKLVIAR